MIDPSDPQLDGLFCPEDDRPEQFPASERFSRQEMVEPPGPGADGRPGVFTPVDLERTGRSESHQRTLRTYPIFDRDGKVARMIGVETHVPSPDGRRPVRTSHAVKPESIRFCGMVGASKEMRALFHLIRRVASSNATILIYGESGTGKELVARAIHNCSPRRRGPFIPVDCGALPESLLESELFGHVKGAFTGATQHKKGLFEAAEGGTLFLDEIGDTSLAFQSKLLRALQEGEIRAVGGTRATKINVRVVAATNASLKEAIARKTFREDLYYRLAVIPIRVPPLRERPDDILPLARHFIQKFAGQEQKGEMHLSPDAAAVLLRTPWRGNIRELENVVERAVLIAPGNVIYPDVLLTDEETMHPGDRFLATGSSTTRSVSSGVPLAAEVDAIRSRAERERIAEAIQRNRGNKALAARALGIARSSLYNKIKRYNLGTSDSTDSTDPRG